MTMRQVAQEEWEAPRTTDPELAEKKLRQFFWALPSEPEARTLSAVDAAAIAGRTVNLPWGRVPRRPVDEQHPLGACPVTVGVDVGKWLCHWTAVAWGPGATPHVLEYGRLEVPSSTMAEELAILTALRGFRDEVLGVGWPRLPQEGEDLGCEHVNVLPDLVLVDSGHWEATVVGFCLESGQGYLPSKGFGVQQLGKRRILQEPGYEPVRQQNGHYLVEINADYWKSFVHSRLQTPTGQPGGLTLFAAQSLEHLSFAKHLTAEKRVEQFVAGRGLVSRWEAVHRNNHWLDALALACVAGHGIGQRIVVPELVAVSQVPRRREPAESTQDLPRSGWLQSYKGRW